MTESILVMACLSVVVERITEILVDSALLKPIRSWWIKLVSQRMSRLYQDENTPVAITDKFLNLTVELIRCGYCVSVWVGLILALTWTVPFTNYIVLNWFYTGILLHGGAGLYHSGSELLRRGRVHAYELTITHTQAKNSPIHDINEDES